MGVPVYMVRHPEITSRRLVYTFSRADIKFSRHNAERTYNPKDLVVPDRLTRKRLIVTGGWTKRVRVVDLTETCVSMKDSTGAHWRGKYELAV